MFEFPFVSRRRYNDLEYEHQQVKLRRELLRTELRASQQSRERLLKNVATVAANQQSLKRRLEDAERSRDFWRKKYGQYIDSINEADEIVRTQQDAAEESNRAALDELEAVAQR